MHIGILTFHNAHNYGAVLQAYALRNKIRKLGHNAEILNYRNKAISAQYPTNLMEGICKPAFYKRSEIKEWKKKVEKCNFQQKEWNTQYQKFEKFINEILLENKLEQVLPENLEKLNIDCFILGSDQIWTEDLTGGADLVYFGQFKTKAKKAVYAASRRDSFLTEEQKSFFEEHLLNFSNISTREKILSEKLSDICKREIETVIDPTLLLSKEDYEIIEEKPKMKSKYVLVYFLCEDEVLSKCAAWLAEVKQLEIVEIHFYKVQGINPYTINRADCGPQEFLGYFSDAEYILTNSFHGCVFSIIYNKKFWAIYDKDDRKDNLLTNLNLKERHIDTYEKFVSCCTNEEKPNANNVLIGMRQKSEQYLLSVLGKN